MTRLRSVAISSSIFAALLFAGSAMAQDSGTGRTDDILTKAETAGKQTAGDALFTNFVVNDIGDATDAVPGNGVCETAAGNGICTLRAAVSEANALAGTDLITFQTGIATISLAAGQIAITSNLSILGPGSGSLTVQNTAPVSTTSRVFNITNFTVNLSGMTISGGNVTGNGGGIQNTGALTMLDIVVKNNSASAVGGGVRSTNILNLTNSALNNNASTASTSGGLSFAGSSLTVRNSSISGNTSSGNGGGMNISASVSATIRDSTISGNTAGASSGGMFTNRGTITNTTISGNTANGALATDGGGGIRIQAGANSVSLVSCTISNNTAPNAAAGARSGIWHETGTLSLANTIVAENIAQDIQRDGAAVLTSGGFNLIGENTSVTTEFPAGLPSGTNYVGTDAAPLNPGIGPLANNGGHTETHALLVSSIAVDAGNSFGSVFDQRRYARTIDLPATPNTVGGDGTDIGSFESQSTPSTAGVSVAGRVTDAAGAGIGKARVVLADSGGNTQTAITNPFGYYRFDNVAAGETYVVSVASRSYQFNPRIIAADDNIADLNFTPEP